MRDHLKSVEEYTSLLERAGTVVNSMGRLISHDPAAIERFWVWFGKSKVVRGGIPLVVFHGTKSDFTQFDPEKSNSNAATGIPKGAFFFSDAPEVAETYFTDKDEVTRFATPALADEFHNLIKNGSFEDQMNFLYDNPKVTEPGYAEGGNIKPVYLRIIKPLRVDAKGYHWNDIYFQPKDYRAPEEFTTNEIAAYAMANGYDGMIVKNVKDSHKGVKNASTIYAVFSPAQIKSAIANVSFNPASHDIREDEDTSGG